MIFKSFKATLAAFLLVVVVAGGAVGWHLLHAPHTLPIETVKVKGQYQYVSSDALKLTLMPYVQNGFFNIDIDAAQNALLSIPGVKAASIRRIFPSTVEITITEQHAIARWDGGGLLTDDGIVFTPRLVDFGNFNNLPLFSGQDSDIPDLLNMYAELSDTLKPYNLKVAALSVDPTGDWQFKTDVGFNVEMGSEDMISRLQAFLRGYQVLLQSQPGNSLVYVDLRYRNGFVVKWQRSTSSPKGKRSNN